MSKRGQITVYVVLGLVIAALVILIIFLRQNVLLSEWEKQRQLALQVPEKAMEVYSFTQGCVQEVADEGLNLLGMQGGYIELPREETQPTPSHPFGESIEIIPDSGMKTAYWFYTTPNRLQKTMIPSKADMQTALADYVDRNIGRCTSNFALFEKYNVTAGVTNTEVRINDDAVLFTVDYPIKIDVEGFRYKLPKIYAKSDARLGELYNVAKEIVEKNSADFYLEEKTIDILAMYKGIPYSGTELTCGQKLWTKTKVLQELKKALSSNMQFIKVKGTAFEAGKNYFEWDALAAGHGNIATTFRYSQNWPVKMDVYPSDGELLVSKPMMDMGNSAMAFLTALFCINDYHFVYDIQYPLVVTLTDENGYSFQFANMVVIDNNQPRENKLGNLDIAKPEDKICGNKAAHAKIYAVAPDANGNLMPVADAEVKLKCVTTVCPLGKTKKEAATGDAVWEGNIPQCYNALLTAEKEGYLEGRQTTSTIDAGAQSVMLEPYREISYEVKVVEDGFERDVQSSETLIINLVNADKGFSTAVVQPTGKIQLIAGDLDLKTTLITQGYEINIKGKEITHCVTAPRRNVLGLIGFTEEQCSTTHVPDTTLSQVMRGGSTTVWHVGRKDLDKGKKVTFYIPATAVPSDNEEMESAYDAIEDPANALLPVIE